LTAAGKPLPNSRFPPVIYPTFFGKERRDNSYFSTKKIKGGQQSEKERRRKGRAQNKGPSIFDESPTTDIRPSNSTSSLEREREPNLPRKDLSTTPPPDRHYTGAVRIQFTYKTFHTHIRKHKSRLRYHIVAGCSAETFCHPPLSWLPSFPHHPLLPKSVHPFP